MDRNGVPYSFTAGGDARLSDEGPDAELGSFPLKALRDVRGPSRLRVERDLWSTPMRPSRVRG